MDQRADDTAHLPPVGQEGAKGVAAADNAQYPGGTAGGYAAPPPQDVYRAAPDGAYQAGGPEGGRTTSSYATRMPPPQPRYARAQAPPGQAPSRQARLAVAHVDPVSVLKISFMISLVCFVVLFVAVAVLYGALDSIGVFAAVRHALANVTSSQGSAGVNAASWFSASTIFGYTALFGVIEVVVIMVLSTVGAGIYNLISRLFGGVEVTLREAE